nr:hypothetical protein [Tanacetum cinerariifolium]
MGMVVYLDEEFYPHFLTTIAGRRWIISCGFRLAVMKCLQSSKYVAALGTAIGLAIDKGIQTELVTGIDHGKARRGLAEVTAYDPFVEERSAGYSLRISNFYCPSTVTATNVSSIPPISVADYEVLNAEPQAVASHSPKIIFEQETLETSLKHPTTSRVCYSLRCFLFVGMSSLSFIIVSTVVACDLFRAVFCP